MAKFLKYRSVPPCDHKFVLSVEKDVVAYIRDSDLDTVLIFPLLTRFHRFLIHNIVRDLFPYLCSFSVGNGDDRHIVVCAQILVFKQFMRCPKPPLLTDSILKVRHTVLIDQPYYWDHSPWIYGLDLQDPCKVSKVMATYTAVPSLTPAIPNHPLRCPVANTTNIQTSQDPFVNVPEQHFRRARQEEIPSYTNANQCEHAAENAPEMRDRRKDRRPDQQVYIPRAKRLEMEKAKTHELAQENKADASMAASRIKSREEFSPMYQLQRKSLEYLSNENPEQDDSGIANAEVSSERHKVRSYSASRHAHRSRRSEEAVVTSPSRSIAVLNGAEVKHMQGKEQVNVQQATSVRVRKHSREGPGGRYKPRKGSRKFTKDSSSDHFAKEQGNKISGIVSVQVQQDKSSNDSAGQGRFENSIGGKSVFLDLDGFLSDTEDEDTSDETPSYLTPRPSENVANLTPRPSVEFHCTTPTTSVEFTGSPKVSMEFVGTQLPSRYGNVPCISAEYRSIENIPLLEYVRCSGSPRSLMEYTNFVSGNASPRRLMDYEKFTPWDSSENIKHTYQFSNYHTCSTSGQHPNDGHKLTSQQESLMAETSQNQEVVDNCSESGDNDVSKLVTCHEVEEYPCLDINPADDNIDCTSKVLCEQFAAQMLIDERSADDKTTDETNQREKVASYTPKCVPTLADGLSSSAETSKGSEVPATSYENNEADPDSWENLFSDTGDVLVPGAVQELHSAVGKVKARKAPHTFYQIQQMEVDAGMYGHLVEIYNFPKDMLTCDLMGVFKDFLKNGFDIKWVDDTHAIGIFCSTVAASEALRVNHPLLKLRPISQGTPATQQKVRRMTDILQPYKARPQTVSTVARKMVANALGLKTNVPKEKQELERQRLNEAREKKRESRRQIDRAWDGKLGKCAMDDV